MKRASHRVPELPGYPRRGVIGYQNPKYSSQLKERNRQSISNHTSDSSAHSYVVREPREERTAPSSTLFCLPLMGEKFSLFVT
uniref:Uncharacterized protein n=1 Tax=Romanomermis culicivorax TaxID=13658 RepID=A0A915L7U7_ROMCU